VLRIVKWHWLKLQKPPSSRVHGDGTINYRADKLRAVL
jgi:hypothetical protein